VPLCPTQTSQGLAWDRTWASELYLTVRYCCLLWEPHKNI